MLLNLNLFQTELVVCTLCEADSKNPDADVLVSDRHPFTIKAWQTYEDEARRFIVASRALDTRHRTLTMFRSLDVRDDQMSSA